MRGKEGREEASGGGIERGREQGREGNFKGGILMRALARCIIGNPGEVSYKTLNSIKCVDLTMQILIPYNFVIINLLPYNRSVGHAVSQSIPIFYIDAIRVAP